MSTWTDGIPADELAERSRDVRPGRVAQAVIAAIGVAAGWVKAAWPHVLRVAGGLAEAIAVLFVAAGWVLGFILWYCPKGAFYGFLQGGRILPMAERAAAKKPDGA